MHVEATVSSWAAAWLYTSYADRQSSEIPAEAKNTTAQPAILNLSQYQPTLGKRKIPENKS